MAESAEGGKGGGIFATIAPALISAASSITKGGPKRQFKYNKKLAVLQNEMNRANAQWAFDKELELRKYQQDYDSPQARMQRYKDAGLNPNLIYGNESAAGSFSPPSFPSVPGVDVGRVDASQSVLSHVVDSFQQARYMAAQTDLIETKTDESTVKQDLMRAQKDLVKANPYMKSEYVNAMVTQLKSIAQLKEQEASFMLSKTMPGVVPSDDRWERGFLKMQMEITQLEQRLKLNTSDLKVKAEIIESKEFENALKEIQVKWMKDAEITPQHVYQGIMLLMQGLMRTWK